MTIFLGKYSTILRQYKINLFIFALRYCIRTLSYPPRDDGNKYICSHSVFPAMYKLTRIKTDPAIAGSES